MSPLFSPPLVLHFPSLHLLLFLLLISPLASCLHTPPFIFPRLSSLCIPPQLTCHDLYMLYSLSAWASTTSLHLSPPSSIDTHYSCAPLTYNMNQQWWLFLCVHFIGSFMPHELTWRLSASYIVNETTLQVVDSHEINITEVETTQWQLQSLEEHSLYRFLLSACTRAGCGPALAQESSTIAEPSEYETGLIVWLKRDDLHWLLYKKTHQVFKTCSSTLHKY